MAEPFESRLLPLFKRRAETVGQFSRGSTCTDWPDLREAPGETDRFRRREDGVYEFSGQASLGRVCPRCCGADLQGGATRRLGSDLVHATTPRGQWRTAATCVRS